MPAYDLPLEELERYKPDREEPADFDSFWQETLREANQFPLEVRFDPVDYGISSFEVFDVSYSGWSGQSIKGWFILPQGRLSNLPCVVEFPSYGGGRGFPFDWLPIPSAGFAYFVMDNRGQGSGWRHGDTEDIVTGGYAPHSPGVMTLGILDPHTYFYRRLFVDAVRACQAVKLHPAVDNERIAATGLSQGGGVSLAVAALEPTIKAILPEAPFLSLFKRATQLVDTPPYNEISNYCQIHRDKVDQVFKTLSYFDVVNFAVRGKIPALFSVGLMDTISPPSTVYASYNWYGGDKEIRVWRYNGHEGGGSFNTYEKIMFLRKIWGKT